jgi:membrane-associated phospholipid phosphatase
VIWQHVGVHEAAALFPHGNAVVNEIAAMPSLHAAYPMLLLLFFWRAASRRLRAVLACYVPAMAFSLVYLGEHFVIDELAGWGCAIAVYFAGSRLLDRREARQQSRVVPEQRVPVAAADYRGCRDGC